MGQDDKQFPRFFHRRTVAVIDTQRLQRNFRVFRDMLPEGAFVCPMVKANAYGHGDLEVSRALRKAGARHLGVGLIEEGIAIRLSGDEGAILMFGIFEEDSVDAIFEFELTPVISEWHQLESLQAAAARRGVKGTRIHIKFNTGMNRLGFTVDQAPKLREWLDLNPGFELEGVCTHLLRGDDAGVPGGESESQFAAFAEALLAFRGLDVQIHALNSSGATNLWKRVLEKKELSPGVFWPLGARPGIGTYGVQPSNDEGASLPLEPVLSFKTHIVSTHRLRVGERLSYNATWRAKRDSTIAVVPVGYADGYMRLLSNKGVVLCRGRRAPVAGTVCMDYFMVDVTDIEKQSGELKPGEEIVMIGEQGGEKVTAQELASLIGTIPYEILTRISERVPRVYK